MGRIPASTGPRKATLGALAASAALALGLPAVAQATTFQVASTADQPLAADAPAGTCVSRNGDGGDGPCTLRAALQAASLIAGDVTVDVPAGTYGLTIPQSTTRVEDGSAGNLTVRDASGAGTPKTVSIVGAGDTQTTIAGDWGKLPDTSHPDRILQIVGDGQPGDLTAHLSGLTITGGRLDTAPACGSQGTTAPAGGGVLVAARAIVTIDGSAIEGNSAESAGAYQGLDGGGIAVAYDPFCSKVSGAAGVAPDVTLTNSTVANNDAGGNGGGFAGSGSGTYVFTGDTFNGNTAGSFDFNGQVRTPGGGAYFGQRPSLALPGDTATFVNDTIADNSAGSSDFFADGGGIDLSTVPVQAAVKGTDPQTSNALSASLTNVTINSNSVSGGTGGNIASDGGAVTLQNTIVADGSGAQPEVVRPALAGGPSENCDDFGDAAGIVSLGHNLVDNNDCNTVAASDVSVSSFAGVGLGPLQANPLLNLDPPGAPATEAISPDSAAVGSADPSACPASDERGLNAAVLGGAAVPDRASPCDIGAFELNADLAVGASASPSPSSAGTPTTFTFTVTDNGPDPAADATFTVTLPGNATLAAPASSSAGACSGETTITCPLGTLGSSTATPGVARAAVTTGATTVTITVRPSGGSSIALTGTASALDADPVSSNNSATATVPLQTVTTTTSTSTSTTTAAAVKPSVHVSATSTTVVPLLPATKACASRRDFVIHIQHVAELHIVSAVIYVNGHREMVVRKHLSGPVDLRRLPYGTFVVRIDARTSSGATLKGKRTYHTCRGHRLPGHRRLKL